MKRLSVRIGAFIVGALLAVAGLECLFRVLPISTGLYRTEQNARWPLQDNESSLRFTYSQGWDMQNVHKGKTNNYGHVTPFDYRPRSGPAIVIGDSFVESLMNDYSDTIQAQLGDLLGSRQSVYGLGANGLSASDYLALSAMAASEFSPTAAVFVIVDGDISESLSPRIGNYYFHHDGNGLHLSYVPFPTGSLSRHIRQRYFDSHLLRYLRANLQFSPEQIIAPRRSGQRSSRVVDDVVLQKQVVDVFLARLPDALGLAPECIAFLIDADRYAIYSAKAASMPKDAPATRAYFVERADALGFQVSDLEPLFRAGHRQDGRRFDHWPIDRHWNRAGHGLGAAEAYRLLFASPQSKCTPNSSRMPGQ
jgi:hypothetical protein